MSRDNLWISSRAPAGAWVTPVAESPKLPEIRHLLWSWDPASGGRDPAAECVTKLRISRKSAIF